MNKIEKRLKKEAGQMLPSSETKRALKTELFGEERAVRKTKPAVRKRIYLSAAVACMLVLSVSLGLAFGLRPAAGGTGGNGFASDTYISIDINPSFEIIADKNDVVKSVKPLNNDGVIVLYGKNFVGMPANEVCAEIVGISLDLEYLDASHNNVKLLTANKDGKKETAVAKTLKHSLEDVLSSRGSSAKVIVKNNDNLNGKETILEEARGKLDILGITEEELETYTVAQINQLLKNYNAKNLEDLEDILEDLYEKEGLDPDDDEIEDKIDRLKKTWKDKYGDDDDDDDDDDEEEEEEDGPDDNDNDDEKDKDDKDD